MNSPLSVRIMVPSTVTSVVFLRLFSLLLVCLFWSYWFVCLTCAPVLCSFLNQFVHFYLLVPAFQCKK